jgi:hypothetical protein
MKNISYLLLLLCSCLPDRELQVKPKEPLPPVEVEDSTKAIRINEINSTGSPDWVEIFNSGKKPVKITANSWFLTDDVKTPKKFTIPLSYTIPAGSHFVVACSTGIDLSTAVELKANFSLSSTGEEFAILRMQNDTLIWVDSLSFPAIPNGSSYGRSPDGGPTLSIFSIPSKGASNP